METDQNVESKDLQMEFVKDCQNVLNLSKKLVKHFT